MPNQIDLESTSNIRSQVFIMRSHHIHLHHWYLRFHQIPSFSSSSKHQRLGSLLGSYISPTIGWISLFWWLTLSLGWLGFVNEGFYFFIFGGDRPISEDPFISLSLCISSSSLSFSILFHSYHFFGGKV